MTADTNAAQPWEKLVNKPSGTKSEKDTCKTKDESVNILYSTFLFTLTRHHTVGESILNKLQYQTGTH